MSNLALLSDEIYMFTDGCRLTTPLYVARECPQPAKLTTAWLNTLNKEPVNGGKIEVAQTPPNQSEVLFTEMKGVIYGLRAVTDDTTINIVTDRPEIITCVNRKIVPPYIFERQPGMVDVFGTLLHEVEQHTQHGIKVWATLPKFLAHHPFAKAARTLVHNFAAEVAGANSKEPENWHTVQLRKKVEAPDFMLQRA